MSAFTSRRISLRAGLILLAAVVLVILPLSGCYILNDQVIPPQLGQVNPYRYSEADIGNGATVNISAAGYYNDYRYHEVYKDGTTSDGTFRVMNITGDVYAVQVVESGDNSIYLLLYHLTPDRFTETDFADANAAQNLASQYNVKLDVANSDIWGTPSNILAFLQASSSLAFK